MTDPRKAILGRLSHELSMTAQHDRDKRKWEVDPEKRARLEAIAAEARAKGFSGPRMRQSASADADPAG